MADTHFETLEKIVYDNDLEALKKEIEAGTDVNLQNKYGWTPLHIAIRRDRRDMVAYLLEEGARKWGQARLNRDLFFNSFYKYTYTSQTP